MKTRSNIFGCFTLSLLTAALSQAVYAAEDAQVMEEVSVYGARPAAFRNITTSTETAGKELIESTNVINTEDAVKYLPSVQVRKRFIGDRNAILASRNAGTLDSARSLVYADNVLVSMLLGNSFSYAPRWWFVSPQEIERVDVSYGAHSAAYAGNAAGVVMVMKSRMPEKFEADADVQAFSQSFKLYGTDETYNGSRAGAFLGNRHDNLRWTLSVGHMENKGHPMSFAVDPTPGGAGTTVVSGYHLDKGATNANRIILGATGIDDNEQDNAKIKLAYDLSPGSRFTYSLGYWRSDSDASVQSYLRDGAGNPVYSGPVKIESTNYIISTSAMQPSKRLEEHWMNSLTWRYDPKSESDWAFEAALTKYEFGTDTTRKPKSTVALPAAASGGAGQVQLLDGTGWHTADVRADWRPEQGKRGHDVAFGYHYDQHNLNDRTYENANWFSGNATTIKAGNTGKTETQGLYVQDAINIRQDMTMTLGLRYEQWRAFEGTTTGLVMGVVTTQSHVERSENFTSPKFSLSWAATDDWLLRGSLSRAARFPTVTELFQSGVSGTSTTISDPTLKPERITAGELAAERGVGDGNVRISFFQDEVTDNLTRQTTGSGSTTTTYQNVGKVRIRGVETSMQRRNAFMPGLDLTGSVTYADSEILENINNPASVGKKMLRIPDWRATLAATWHASDKTDFTLAGRYSGRQYNMLDNTDVNPDVYGGTSKFFVMDAKFNYRFDKRFSMSVGVDNLNNEKYYAAHPYTQRTWIVQVKGKL